MVAVPAGRKPVAGTPIKSWSCHFCDRSGPQYRLASRAEIVTRARARVPSLPLSLPYPFHLIPFIDPSLENVCRFRRRDCRNYKQITRCFHRRRLERCADRPSTDLRTG